MISHKTMFKNSVDIALKYKRFLKEIIDTQEVWTLENESSYASSVSNHYEGENEKPLILQVFWSNKKEATVCARQVWKEDNFNLKLIQLKNFVEFWCVGMHQDNIIVGTNFDYQLFGYEEEPLVLARDILEAIRGSTTQLNLENYSSIEEYLKIIINHL